MQSVIDAARNSTIDRIKRCCPIMGRKEGDQLQASQIMYPCMQCTDIFFLKTNIASLGLDQRKVNTFSRAYAENKYFSYANCCKSSYA